MINGTLIIFDFEVFKYDTLLGAYIISSNNEMKYFRTWNLDEMKALYKEHIESIWIGHNNSRYDNLILQTIVLNGTQQEVREKSKAIVNLQYKQWLDIKLNFYDVMTAVPTALKITEALDGKNISETQVDFDIDRHLTEEEKRLTEEYNRDDLNQTLENFIRTSGVFNLRLQMINEFNLPMHALHMTEAQIAETVLHAKKTPGIDKWVLKPFEYDTLRVKNETIKNFFFSEEYLTKKLTVDICGVQHKLGLGGIHGARTKYHAPYALYFDVSGYYNLVMINYDLLPRSIDDEYIDLYPTMYKQQLEFKKTAPEKRWAYKTILLAVFGAMFNENCKFYDPYKASLVTMTGQLFLVDLLEKLEGKVELVQSNTDGIIAVPLVDKSIIFDIINEWQSRTGFVLHLDEITDIHQRDVNCYMYKKADGSVNCLGEYKHYQGIEKGYDIQSYSAKEAIIISMCVVNYLMLGKLPEQTVEENKRVLQAFQFICRKNTYDYVEYEEVKKDTGEVKVTRLQNINRAFALKSDTTTGMLFKNKPSAKAPRVKMQNLPDSVFVYNQEILSDDAINKLIDKIDFDYYINQAYNKISTFYNITQVKKII